ncbi:MAG: PorV/PorQ family protein [Calditrichia bacterium]
MFRKCAFILFIFTISGYAAGAGETGLSFLEVGVDARGVGMGEAHTAAANGAAALFWNPAGQLGADPSNALFNHNEWLEGIRGESAALSLRSGRAAWGFQVRSFNIGEIEVRDIPSSLPLEETSAHYLSAGLSYARRFGDRLDVGITGKYLFEKIYVESASGLALDVGAIYQLPAWHLKIGAALTNAGSMGKLKNDETVLPTTIRAGLYYQLPLNSPDYTAALAADAVKPFKKDGGVHIGGEFTFLNHIALRGGWLIGYENRSFSGGLGVFRSSIRFDYALIPFDKDFGVTHRLTLSFNL